MGSPASSPPVRSTVQTLPSPSDPRLASPYTKAARSLPAAAALVAGLRPFNTTTKNSARIRDHLVGVAAIARLLGLEWGNQAGAIFACGLLHDIGKLLLIQVGEIDYDALPAPMLARPDRSHLYEL